MQKTTFGAQGVIGMRRGIARLGDVLPAGKGALSIWTPIFRSLYVWQMRHNGRFIYFGAIAIKVGRQLELGYVPEAAIFLKNCLERFHRL